MTIESKKREADSILQAVGIPVDALPPRRRERVALALLAVANLKPDTPWSEAACWKGPGSWALKSREIIAFWNAHYGENVSSGSYDDVRRKDLILLLEASLVAKSASKPGANTNDPTRRYAIVESACPVLTTFGTPEWVGAVAAFRSQHGVLRDRLERVRQQAKIPVRLPDGKTLNLDTGEHNVIQKAIIEEFLPRYTVDPTGTEVLYVGDTSKKIIVRNDARLLELGFFELEHGLLPDVVAYDAKRNLIFLIEAVHSANPISKTRHLELERLTAKCKAPRVYVSAFLNRAALRQWLLEISWETEVWLVESPDHLIHFDGNKFLGPYDPTAG